MKLDHLHVYGDKLRKHIEEMEGNLARWRGETDDKAQFEEKLQKLREKRQVVDTKLDKLDQANPDNASAVREELDEVWTDMMHRYDVTPISNS